MKLPSLLEISLGSNAVARKQLYRIAIVIRFPQVVVIDGKEVTDEERQRAHVSLKEYAALENTVQRIPDK
jgi:Leucine-rich repeat